MVGQEPTLFASSIKDNIAYGCSATDYQVCSVYSTITAFQSLYTMLFHYRSKFIYLLQFSNNSYSSGHDLKKLQFKAHIKLC